MIHLDTNLLIDLVTVDSPHAAEVAKWLKAGHLLGTSAIAWSEFCNGPHSKAQKDAIFNVLESRVADFGWREAEQASRLFHLTGRRRGSHADCMIAAAAIVADEVVATRNIDDFERFVPHGLKLRRVKTVA